MIRQLLLLPVVLVDTFVAWAYAGVAGLVVLLACSGWVLAGYDERRRP